MFGILFYIYEYKINIQKSLSNLWNIFKDLYNYKQKHNNSFILKTKKKEIEVLFIK